MSYPEEAPLQQRSLLYLSLELKMKVLWGYIGNPWKKPIEQDKDTDLENCIINKSEWANTKSDVATWNCWMKMLCF